MKYVSTNGRSPAATFRDAIFTGLAPDGGLYVPQEIPPLSRRILQGLSASSLHELGAVLATHFIDDIPENILAAIVKDAWSFPIPLVSFRKNVGLLELFHGPTLAFKDVGARFLARVMSHYLDEGKKDVTILVATSGDTGSAVAHGFFGVPHVRVFVLYPSGRVSPLQEKQMATLGGNIHALEVDGTFDDCQKLVKEALADTGMHRAYNITTANSISLGRLIPQIVFYAWGVAQWMREAGKGSDDGPTVVVPSGNFGNLTAAAYAKVLGIPIRALVAATNANVAVNDYLSSGSYRPRPSIATLSNAMDVGHPSNFARLLSLYHNDVGEMKRMISAISISDDETLQEIRRSYEETGKIPDPHTAVGVAAARQLGENVPVIVAATAHPAKFPDTIERAIGKSIPLPPALADVLHKPKQSVRMEATYSALRSVISG